MSDPFFWWGEFDFQTRLGFGSYSRGGGISLARDWQHPRRKNWQDPAGSVPVVGLGWFSTGSPAPVPGNGRGFGCGHVELLR